MKKFFEFFRSSLFLPVAALLLLYTYWLFFIPTKTFFSNWDLQLGMLCLTIYFTIIVLGKVCVDKPRLAIIPYVFAVPLSLFAFSYGVLYLSLMFEFYEMRPIFPSFLGIVLISFVTYKKLARQNKEQAIFSIITLPIFVFAVFNFVNFCPSILEVKVFEGHKYYIIEEIWDYTHSDTNFYKCKILSFQCNQLGWTNYGNSGILVDEQKKEVSLIDPRGLRYTDGLNPRSYSLSGAQFGDHIYYLSEKCNNFNYNRHNECESYTFIPYQCNLDNKSCDPLPIKVEGDFDYTIYWKTNETNKEISLVYTDDEILVFTYGEHIQCFVKECEILQQ